MDKLDKSIKRELRRFFAIALGIMLIAFGIMAILIANYTYIYILTPFSITCFSIGGFVILLVLISIVQERLYSKKQPSWCKILDFLIDSLSNKEFYHLSTKGWDNISDMVMSEILKKNPSSPNHIDGSETRDWNQFGNIIAFRKYVYPFQDLIAFQIQNGPIKEVGENGCQIDELLKVWLEIIKHIQIPFPCEENTSSIDFVEKALALQEKRRLDREKRKVEGLDKL